MMMDYESHSSVISDPEERVIVPAGAVHRPLEERETKVFLLPPIVAPDTEDSDNSPSTKGAI